jgi:predicted anti-sigma-YlaC factor YlaD
MNDPLCQRLDDYLAHDLMGAEQDKFVAHLDSCAACRAAVREAEELSSRLRSACERFDPVPPDLAVSITGRIDAMRWRRRALAAIALAASIGFVAFWLSRDGSVPDTTPKTISPPIASAAAPVRVTFPDHQTLAVPVESESPNVTVLLVYPNLRTELPENPERNEP